LIGCEVILKPLTSVVLSFQRRDECVWTHCLFVVCCVWVPCSTDSTGCILATAHFIDDIWVCVYPKVCVKALHCREKTICTKIRSFSLLKHQFLWIITQQNLSLSSMKLEIWSSILFARFYCIIKK
jgi:hypothetical protein